MNSESSKTVMLPDLVASMQFTRYLVDDLTFKCNEVSRDRKAVHDEPRIQVDFNIKENTVDKNQYLVEMVVDLNQAQDLTKFDTYQIHLHLYGWFTLTTNLDEQTKAKLIGSNASAMLYGVARSIIANLTGSVGPKRFMLPTVNLLAILKAKADRDSAKASPPAPSKKKLKLKRS